jgi:hypothetical protein
MAAMGTRELTSRKPKPKVPSDTSLGQVAVADMNLIVHPFHIQPVATIGYQPVSLGAPIMREGFVTDTGFLIGSSQRD